MGTQTDQDWPPGEDPLGGHCSGREIFNHITGRWGLLILVALVPDSMRFHVLRDSIVGVSEKMLAETLRTLTRDGLVRRMVEPTTPPRVSYELTQLGRGVSEPMLAVMGWLGDNIDEIQACQARFDAAAD
jgi:DNA-binding HxlR family transcriptional regulator